jgi:membrane associated rhomboid family serine protease
MGIYDRDYYRNAPRGGFGAFALFSVTTWLVILNVGIYIADAVMRNASMPRDYGYDNDNSSFVERRAAQRDPHEVVDDDEPAARSAPPQNLRAVYEAFMGPLQRLGYFSIDTAIRHLQLWRVITFQFLHASPSHLVYNMLALLLFGPIVEGHFGPRRYLAFYLSCGVAGALMYVLLWATRLLVYDPAIPMVGASAGIFGVLIGAARFAPDLEVPFILPMRVATLAYCALAMAVLVVLTRGGNAGGEAGHLGGALWGLLLVHQQHLLNVVVPARKNAVYRGTGRRRRANRFQKDWSKDPNR